MSKVKPDAAQGPDQIIGDARKPYLLHALQVMNRRRSGAGFLFNDDEGHETFVCWRALGLLEKDWGNVAPWFMFMSKTEREAFDQRTAEFALTLRNISTASRFTRADRARYGHDVRLVGTKKKRSMQALLQLSMIDADLEEVRRDERNAARRERHAAAVGISADPRERAVIEAVMRIARQPGAWHDYSVPSIIRSIERTDDRALFPHSHQSFRRIVYRLIDRLAERGATLPDLGLNTSPVSTEKFVTPCDACDTVTPTLVRDKPLKQRHFVVTPHGPEPKQLAQDTSMSDLKGETVGLANAESVTTAGPHQAANPVERTDQVSDGASAIDHHRAASDDKEQDDMRPKLTKEQRKRIKLEMAYIQQRLNDITAHYGLDEDDADEKPVEIKASDDTNVVRLRVQ